MRDSARRIKNRCRLREGDRSYGTRFAPDVPITQYNPCGLVKLRWVKGIPLQHSVDIKTLGRSAVLGAASNVLALASVIGILYLGFAVVGVFYGLANTLARAGSELEALTDKTAGELVLESLGGTFSNAVNGLIAAWPAFIVFAVLGIVAATGWFLSGSLTETPALVRQFRGHGSRHRGDRHRLDDASAQPDTDLDCRVPRNCSAGAMCSCGPSAPTSP